MKGLFFQAALLLNLLSLATAAPLFTKVDSETWIFGNKLWNVTQKGKNARPLYYKNKELVGNAQGHYYSSSKSSRFGSYLSLPLQYLLYYRSCVMRLGNYWGLPMMGHFTGVLQSMEI